MVMLFIGMLECLRRLLSHSAKTDESYSNSEIGTNWNVGMSAIGSNIPNRSKNSVGICNPVFYRLKWLLALTFQDSNRERENKPESKRGGYCQPVSSGCCWLVAKEINVSKV